MNSNDILIQEIKEKILFSNKKLENVIKKCNFTLVSDNLSLDKNKDIFDYFKESKILVINQYSLDQISKEGIYIICFEKTVLFIQQNSLNFLNSLFKNNLNIQIFFLPNAKDSLKNFNQFSNKEIIDDRFLLEEISPFIRLLITKSLNSEQTKILKATSPCLFSYLIRKSYIKSKCNRMNNFTFENNDKQIKTLKKDDYISIGPKGFGASFNVELIYHIDDEQLLLIKRENLSDEETLRLKSREIENYKKINHPLFPKFYGLTEENHNIVIEYINGYTLYDIFNKANNKRIKLSDNEKITIIFEIMHMIEYLHKKKLVYRDLKPDNVIINENKVAFLIDFDSIVEYNDRIKDDQRTGNFGSIFSESNEYLYTNDIYSIGKMIYYIMNEENQINKSVKSDKLDEYPELKEMYIMCICEDRIKRPSITQLIYTFVISYHQKIIKNHILELYEKCSNYIFGNVLHSIINNDINEENYQIIKLFINKIIDYLTLAANQNHPEAQFVLARIYYEGKYITQDINKSIQYFSLAAAQNHPDAQYNLGIFYYEGKYITRDIKKSIQYFSLAAAQNHLNAQFILGNIYYEDKYITRDINKSIQYFSLAAAQNHLDAQFALASIYYEGKYITRDIKKSIQYFSLAAARNHPDAQFILGNIYYEGKYITRDIKKSIYYFSLAAAQNHLDAQFILGNIYYEGKYITRDINKSIHYFSLAANQNDSYALLALGLIYYEEKYIKRDINKSIHYLTLAANQSNQGAQFTLGSIYYEGKYITQDINKSIYYYSLAADQNNLDAQFNLGLIYYECKYIACHINKSIQYFSLAANQNHPKAQFTLGVIYYEGKYIARDINKSIHYFSLAANHNNLDAQYLLGVIYYDGKYIARDINKSIQYFSLAANQNYLIAQYLLGVIYYEGKYITRDINKSIHYYSLAANQNHSNAQNSLGVIYHEGKYIKQDINKSIHYYSLAANQNHSNAQFNLGLIYYEDKYITQDINKSIHYYTLAANQNHSNAQNSLGVIYYEGKYITRDINKSIYYFSLAANQNHPEAQFNLGIIYSNDLFTERNIYKGIDYFIQSSSNGHIGAHFAVGYFYNEGKYVEKDIKKSIHHYKDASSFNDQFAKNNLGIIYKHGFGDEIPQNIGYAIDYFNETIGRKNDKVSMYNLAHIYIYEDLGKEKIDESIKLLIRSSEQDFIFSDELLTIALIKKHGFNIKEIQEELTNITNKNYLTSKICQMIHDDELLNKSNFEKKYQFYKNIDFIYDFLGRIKLSSTLSEKKPIQATENNMQNMKNLTDDFYEGFGFQIEH